MANGRRHGVGGARCSQWGLEGRGAGGEPSGRRAGRSRGAEAAGCGGARSLAAASLRPDSGGRLASG